MSKSTIISLVIILLSFLIGWYVYPMLPDLVATHWNISGQADAYSPKSLGVFSIPLLSLGLLVLFTIIPTIDPLRENIAQFKQTYQWFITVIIGFLFYLYMLVLLWNLGYQLNMSQWLMPAFAVLFYFMGELISKAKQNWFIGIRTPWTLSSESVWEKTHKQVSILFKILAVVTFLGVVFPAIAFWLFIIPVVVITVYSFVYSYIVYKHEHTQ